MESSILLNGIDAVIVRLRILASIQPGDKLRVRQNGEDVEIDSPSPVRSLARFVRKDSRAATMDAISRIISAARRTRRSVERDATDLRHLMRAAQAALDGMRALRQTYGDDPSAVARIDALIYRLEDIFGPGDKFHT